jgi:3,4-dihydroxy 2-butanone 4-phosphate synthase / GTP cyclohydrolase II
MSVRILEVSRDVPVRNRIGMFTLRAYLIAEGPHIDTHLAIFKGPFTDPVPVRINSACLTGEVFGDRRCDCAWQMWEALRRFETRGQGVMTYHPSHEGRGIGLFQKIRSYELMDELGLTTREAFQQLGEVPDLRTYGAATAILKHLDVRSAQFLSNNPEKIKALEDSGIEVVGSERVVMDFDSSLVHYLQSKAVQFGHLIELPTFMLGVPETEDLALWPQRVPDHDLDPDAAHEVAEHPTATGA